MSWYDTIECPYCGHEHTMSNGDFEGTDNIDIECENEECEKEFMVEREWTPSYSASTIEYGTCPICDKEERSEEMIYSKDNYVCRACYFKREIENLKTK